MIKKPLKKFLLAAAICLTGFFVSVFLHNFFYALGVLTSGIPVIHFMFELLHGAFFIIGVIVYPAAFILITLAIIINAIIKSA